MHIVLAFFVSLLVSIAAEADDDRPPVNILFILTDDQRWDSLGCYGNKVVRTPNLDKLASEGARLDSFYSAAPLCCPSRATFLSGLYAHQTGITSNGTARNRPDLSPEIVTVAEYLNQAGYTTGFVGKAHLGGDPRKWGFKHCPLYLSDGETRYQNPRLLQEGKPTFHTGEITTILADAAIRFIELNTNQPWFLWFATTAPHEPYVPENLFSYEVSEITAPPGWPPGRPFQPNKEWVGYYSTISVLDTQVGRILKKVDELGLRDKTFVFMVSDNGYMFGSHGIYKKNTWFDEASRVPAIVRWPGKIKNGVKLASLFSSVDLLPTLLQLAGAHPEKEPAGLSMLPALRDEKPVRTEVFSEINRDTVFVRQGQWKYVQYGTRKEFLYNLKVDPFEEEDLSKDPEQASVVEQLKKSINEWLRRTPPLSNLSGESNQK